MYILSFIFALESHRFLESHALFVGTFGEDHLHIVALFEKGSNYACVFYGLLICVTVSLFFSVSLFLIHTHKHAPRCGGVHGDFFLVCNIYHISVYMCICICIYIFMYINIYVYLYIYIDIYMYIHIYA